MIQIQREVLTAELIEEGMPMLEAGFLEYDPHPHIPLEIAGDVYLALEGAGKLRVYTARIEGRLVGYAVFIVACSPRRKAVLQAQQDLVHAAKDTAPRVTPRLLRFAEKALRDDGVRLLYHSIPINGCGLGRLLEILGYQPIAQVYAKLLN